MEAGCVSDSGEAISKDEGSPSPLLTPTEIPLRTVPMTAVDPTKSHGKIFAPGVGPDAEHTAHYPNTGELIPIDNDVFTGVFLLRTRTEGDSYFASPLRAQRAFEIQIQGTFKKQPEGKAWLGLEVTKPQQLTRLKRLAAAGMLRFVAAMGWTFHVSTCDPNVPGDLAHLVYPFLSSMDCVIVTPPGDPLPSIGEDLMELEVDQHFKTLQSLPEDFIVGHTYTMCYFCRYIDFESWAFIDIPGFSPLDLHGFWSDASVRFVCYAHPDETGPHLPSERQTFIEFEVIHDTLPRYQEVPTPAFVFTTPPGRSTEAGEPDEAAAPTMTTGNATGDSKFEDDAGVNPESLRSHNEDAVTR